MRETGVPTDYRYAQGAVEDGLVTYNGATFRGSAASLEQRYSAADEGNAPERRSIPWERIAAWSLLVVVAAIGSAALGVAVSKANSDHTHGEFISVRRTSQVAAAFYATGMESFPDYQINKELFNVVSDSTKNVAPQTGPIFDSPSYTALVTLTSPVNASKWRNVMDTVAPKWAEDEKCYFHVPLMPPSVNKCVAETYHACAGTMTFAEMCFGQFDSSKAETYTNYPTVYGYNEKEPIEYMSEAFLQNVIDVYHAASAATSDGTLDEAVAFRSLDQKVLPCWKAAYELVNAKDPNVDIQYLMDIINDGQTSSNALFYQSKLIIHAMLGANTAADRFERAVAFAIGNDKNTFEKRLKNIPVYMFSVNDPLNYFDPRIPSTLLVDDANDLEKVYDAVFSAARQPFWAEHAHFPATFNGVKCADIRTDYANPRGESRVVKSADKSKVHCVGGGKPYGCAFDDVSGECVEAMDAYSFVKCDATPENQNALKVYNRDELYFHVKEATPGRVTDIADVSNAKAILHVFTDNAGESLDYTKLDYNAGLPVFKQNSLAFIFKSSTDNSEVTSGDVADVVTYQDGVETALSSEIVQSDSPGSTTGAVVGMVPNALPVGNVWVRYTYADAPDSMYTKLTVVDRDPVPTIVLRDMSCIVSSSTGAKLFGTVEAEAAVWACVEQMHVPLLEELEKVRDALPETARLAEARFSDAKLLAVANTTAQYNDATYPPFARLDCATWTEMPESPAYDECAEVVASSTAGVEQVVSFRLRDRYGNAQSAEGTFVVTA